MHVLLVAPKTNLFYAELEVRKVSQYLNPYILEGNDVTSVRLLEELLRGTYDLLWMATHSSEEGFLLSDGVISPAEFATDIKTSSIERLFLNSCASVHTAVLINENLGLELICSILDIPDREAFKTGMRLAYHLSRDSSFARAYELSRPIDNRQYLYLPGSMMTKGEQRTVASGVESVHEDVKRLIMLMEGNRQYNITGVLQTIEKLDQRVLRNEGRLSLMTTVLGSLTIVNVIMLIAIVVTIIRSWP